MEEAPEDYDDFGPKITIDDLPQSDPRRRKKLRRTTRKAHLLATSACLGLASTIGLNIIDSGKNLHHLGNAETHTNFVDPFKENDPACILETDINSSHDGLDHDTLLRKMHLQYLDIFEDAKSGFEFQPTEVIAHKNSVTPRKILSTTSTANPVRITKDKHLRVKTCWKNGEVSWVSADALREQHPWALANYAVQNNLLKHPRFEWTKAYISQQKKMEELKRVHAMAAKGQQIPLYKFGAQVPMNVSHALYLDKLNNNNLWQEAMDKEIMSINDFKTFRVLAEGEELPEGYTRIPYHIVFDVKFDGRHKARLVAGGHRTPSVSHEEVYSGVVGMDTIRMAFVLASLNELEVCAADISTAFLYGKTREKVYVIAGKEFGEHAGKRMVIEGGLYGLKSSSARFHAVCAAHL